MNKISITKKEYQNLVNKSLRYEYLRQILEEDFFSPPQTRNSNEVVKGFYNTGKYSKNFIKSLSRGLKRSSYFK